MSRSWLGREHLRSMQPDFALEVLVYIIPLASQEVTNMRDCGNVLLEKILREGVAVHERLGE